MTKRTQIHFLRGLVYGFLLTSCATQDVRKNDVQPVSREPATISFQENAPPIVAPGLGVGASAEYHFSLAQAYVAEGNTDRAIEEYKLTLMYDPHSALVWTRLSAEYAKKNTLADAMDAAKRALHEDPGFSDARMVLAGLYALNHETDEALGQYDQVLKKNPSHEEAVAYKSQLLLENDRAEEAARFLKVFVKKNPESVLGWYYLERACGQMEKFEETVAAYKKALELRPGLSQAALALGQIYEEKQMNNEAAWVYRALYEENQDPYAANRLATIFLKNQKYKEAVPYLEAVIAMDPEDMNSRVKLGLVYMEMKNYEKAQAYFETILSKSPDSDRIRFYLGSLYEETLRLANAIVEYNQVKPDSKFYPDAMLHVAYLYKRIGQVEESKNVLDGAIAKNPRISGFYIFQASLYEDEKDMRSAVKTMEKASELFPVDEKVQYYLGGLYDKQGDREQALKRMEQVLEANPNNADALNYLGYTWTEMGVRLADAETHLKKALSIRPEDPYIMDSWGWHLFVRGKTAEAIVVLEKAAIQKPNEAVILDHLADAYLKANLRGKAYAKYQEALKYANTSDHPRIMSKIDNLKTEIARKDLPSQNKDSSRAPASVKTDTP